MASAGGWEDRFSSEVGWGEEVIVEPEEVMTELVLGICRDDMSRGASMSEGLGD